MSDKKTIVVVGAGDGLGLSIARKFGQQGFKAALIARNPEKLAKLVETLKSEGIEARAFPADVQDQPSLVRALNEIRYEYGPVEVLEYSPEPHTPPKNLREWMPTTMTIAECQRRMDLSCFGAIVAVNQVLPDMLARGSGTILVTASGSGKNPIKTLTAVALSMAALINYAHALNEEISGKGVHAAVVILNLLIEQGDQYGDPDILAAQYWDQHLKRDTAELMISTPLSSHEHHIEDMKKYNVEMPQD